MPTDRRTTALILGKFLPPHRGHRYLAEAARDEADDVVIALLANSTEPIPVEVRHAWLEELFPWATVRSTVADHRIDYSPTRRYVRSDRRATRRTMITAAGSSMR